MSARSGPPGREGTTTSKRALRRRLTAVDAASDPAADVRVYAHLQAQAGFRRARRVVLYAALPDEVATRPLFEALRSDDRPCLLPRMVAGTRLEFAAVADWDELVVGRLGVREPPAEAPAEGLGPADWVLVPGLAFDSAGNRLGRGAGYYDRTFPPEAPDSPCLVGVAREARLLESVPSDSHDRAMDAMVTERAFWWTRGEAR